jgi:hypothetical protein
MVDVSGKKISSKTGYVEGNISGIQNVYYDGINKRYLTKEEAKEYNASDKKSHNIKLKTVAVMNVNDEVGKTQNTVLVDAGEIKGKFKSPKKKEGQKDFDDLIEENKTLAKEKMKSGASKKSAEDGDSKPSKKTIKESDIAAKAKASGYSAEEYRTLLQKNGVEITK